MTDPIPTRRDDWELDPGSRSRMDSAASISLVLGLIGMLVCAIASPFAIFKANEARRIANAARIPEPGTATAGRVLGWIGSVFLILGLLLVLAIVALGVIGAIAGGASPR